MVIMKVMLKMLKSNVCVDALCIFLSFLMWSTYCCQDVVGLCLKESLLLISAVSYCFISIEFPGQARYQVCENIPMRKSRDILEYLKWDLVSQIHFPIFDAVVSFFWKIEVIQVKTKRTTIKLTFAWLAWQKEFLLQPLLIDTYWWPTF